MGHNLTAPFRKLRDESVGEPPVIVRPLIVKNSGTAGAKAVKGEVRAHNTLKNVNKAGAENKIPKLGYAKSRGGRRYNDNSLILRYGRYRGGCPRSAGTHHNAHPVLRCKPDKVAHGIRGDVFIVCDNKVNLPAQKAAGAVNLFRGQNNSVAGLYAKVGLRAGKRENNTQIHRISGIFPATNKEH